MLFQDDTNSTDDMLDLHGLHICLLKGPLDKNTPHWAGILFLEQWLLVDLTLRKEQDIAYKVLESLIDDDR